MKRLAKGQRGGFSLTEIMVAAGLLTALLVPVLVFNQRGLIESGVTQEELLGRQLLMDLCERYKASSPDQLKQAANHPERFDTDDYLIPLKRKGEDSPMIRFARRVEFTPDLDGVKGLHKVTFRVAWTSRHRKNQSASLSRLIHWH
jgi:hypothetical protein